MPRMPPNVASLSDATRLPSYEWLGLHLFWRCAAGHDHVGSDAAIADESAAPRSHLDDLCVSLPAGSLGCGHLSVFQDAHWLAREPACHPDCVLHILVWSSCLRNSHQPIPNCVFRMVVRLRRTHPCVSQHRSIFATPNDCFECGCQLRRVAFQILWCLLLGAIINVVVAWGCALFVDVNTAATFSGFSQYMPADQTVSDRLSAVRANRFGSTVVAMSWMYVEIQVDLDWMNNRVRFMTSVDRKAESSRGLDGGDMLKWMDIAQWTERADPGIRKKATKRGIWLSCRVLDARGWPLRSMFVVLEPGPKPGWTVLSRACPSHLPDWQAPREEFQASARLVPLGIIWLGFAIDTIFYATLAWTLFAFPGIVRRRLRAHGGRCTTCGYDLRHRKLDARTCPECGDGASSELRQDRRSFPWMLAAASCLAGLVIVGGAMLAFAWPFNGQRFAPGWSVSVPTPQLGILFTDEQIARMIGRSAIGASTAW